MGVIRFLGQHKGAVALVVVLLALKAVCDLALPVFTSQIVDVGIAQSGVEDVGVLEGYRAAGVDLLPIQMAYLARTGLAMLAVAAAAMVLDVAVSFVASRTGAAIGRDLRSQLFGRIVAFSDAEINRFSAASLITRGTNDVVLIQNVCTMMLRMVLYAPILAIGGVVMVMATNPQLGWIVVVAVAAVFAVIAVLFRLTLPRFKIMQKLIDRVNLVAREMLTGLSVVRAFNRDGYEEARFDDASRRLMRTQLSTNRAMAFMMPSMMLVMNLTSVAIVWFGAGAVGGGTLQTGDLIAFITYAMVIIMGCLMMGMISIMLPRADVAAQRIREVLACEIAVRDPEDAAAEGAAAKGAANSDRQAPGCGVPSRADSAANGTAQWAVPPSEDLPEHVGAASPSHGGHAGAGLPARGQADSLAALAARTIGGGTLSYDGPLPVRPPVLCAGCPHRGSFYAVKQALKGREAVLCGDIGCYTLGNAKPLDAVDTCLCMGAGITMAQGFSVVEPHKKSVAFVGDSTFFASAMTGIANAVYNGHDVTFAILDNATTAMTGSQPHPGTGVTLMGEKRRPIVIEEVLHGLGVQHIGFANPHSVEMSVAVARAAIDYDGPAAIIFRAPCIQLKKPAEPVRISTELCAGCKKCITSIGCPGIGFDEGRRGPKSGERGQAFVDGSLCDGCALCVQVCPFGAIEGAVGFGGAVAVEPARYAPNPEPFQTGEIPVVLADERNDFQETELRGEPDQTPGEVLGAAEGSLEEGGAR